MQFRYWLVAALVMTTISGCADRPFWKKPDHQAQSAASLPDGTVRPMARPEQPDEDAAPVSSASATGPLGSTIVSLGTPTEPGKWLKTPLVSSPGTGRVSYRGKSLEMRLIPISGEASAGSRLSLEAMQTLGISLTDLAEVQVTGL